MISLSQFCTLHSALLNSILPRTQDVIRFINGNSKRYGKFEYHKTGDNFRPVVSESAFRYASIHIGQKGVSLDNWHENATLLNKLFLESTEYIAKLSRHGLIAREATESEQQAVFYEAKSILEFLLDQGQEESTCVLRPILPGCGSVGDAEADIEYGSVLWELKSYSIHGFSSYSLRQLLCYATLRHVSGEGGYTHVGLCNPHRKRYFVCTVDQMVSNCSSMSTPRVMSLIAEAMENHGREEAMHQSVVNGW